VAFAAIWLLPTRHLILTEIAWLGLFALSLDLIVGYAGIISLGHAAFFGVAPMCGAARQARIDQRTGIRFARRRSCGDGAGFRHQLPRFARSDLTRLMVSLGVALMLRELANQFGWLTGGADGLQGVTMQPILGLFRFDMFGHNGFVYSLIVLFVLFLVARNWRIRRSDCRWWRSRTIRCARRRSAFRSTGG